MTNSCWRINNNIHFIVPVALKTNNALYTARSALGLVMEAVNWRPITWDFGLLDDIFAKDYFGHFWTKQAYKIFTLSIPASWNITTRSCGTCIYVIWPVSDNEHFNCCVTLFKCSRRDSWREEFGKIKMIFWGKPKVPLLIFCRFPPARIVAYTGSTRLVFPSDISRLFPSCSSLLTNGGTSLCSIW